jgi:hypothetical protein
MESHWEHRPWSPPREINVWYERWTGSSLERSNLRIVGLLRQREISKRISRSQNEWVTA